MGAMRRAAAIAIGLLLAAVVATPVSVLSVDRSSANAQAPAQSGQVDASSANAQSKEVLGFFQARDIDHMLHTADYSVLSTIAFFGIAGRRDGTLMTTSHGRPDSRWTAWNSPAMDRIIAKAHAAGTKVVLSFTRFGWTSASLVTTARMLSNPAARSRMAHAIAAEVRRRGIDGANIDFEPIPGSQKHTFVTFVHQVRSALNAINPSYQLTVAATGYIANYDAGGIVSPGGADAIYIMAYQYHGNWSTTTGSIAPLTRNGYDMHDTIANFVAHGAPASKLILGQPYYGYEWPTVSGKVDAATLPAGHTYGYNFSVLYSTAVAIAAAHGRLWDPVEHTPWVRWQSRNCSTCPLTWHELYYDDAQSLGLKYDMVNADGLRGVGIWCVGYEGGRTELNALLREKFGSH